MIKLLLFTIFVAVATSKHEEYQGNKVYKIKPVTDAHFKVLNDIDKHMEGADFWLRPTTTGRHGYIMIPPNKQTTFETVLGLKGIEFEVIVTDVKSMLEKEDEILEESVRRSNYTRNGPLQYDRYYRYAEIDAYIDYLGRTFPSRAQVVTAGRSSQGREIKYVRVSNSNFQDPRKPLVVIDGGIHAREWIAPPMVTFILRKLVEENAEPSLLDAVDWIILPLVNPDGYEFSHTNSRLWRKTRSTGHIAGNVCVGVDGNRNYAFQWMVSGSSQVACSDTFAGPRPLSEPEVQIVDRIIIDHLSRLKLYVTIHSFGSYIIYPWGHENSYPSNRDELHAVAQLAASAIDAASLPGAERYLIGNTYSILSYLASGASEDHARSLGVPLAYTIELPGESSWSQTGFELHPSRINQVVHETWEGIKVLARETARRYG